MSKFNIFQVWCFASISFNFRILVSYFVGLLCLFQFDVIISSICSLFFLFILNKIDYDYISTSLAKNKGKNGPFVKLITIGVVMSFARINDMTFISNFGKTGLFGIWYSPVIFGILYVWISVFSLIHGSLMQRGYTRLLICLIVISLFLCNVILSFGLYEDSFIFMNIILLLLGFASAGEESVLVTLLRNDIPDPNLFGMYFGIFDSTMAIAKLLGMFAINGVWFLFGESIVMAGRFCAIMIISGISFLFLMYGVVLKNKNKVIERSN